MFTPHARVNRASVLALLLAVLVMTLSMAPAPAAAALVESSWFITLTSQSGDYVGGGQHRIFTNVTATAEAEVVDGYVELTVSQPTEGEQWILEFVAASGKEFRTGFHRHAEYAPYRSSGRPGLSVNGGRCNSVSGHFDVRDFHRTANQSGGCGLRAHRGPALPRHGGGR